MCSHGHVAARSFRGFQFARGWLSNGSVCGPMVVILSPENRLDAPHYDEQPCRQLSPNNVRKKSHWTGFNLPFHHRAFIVGQNNTIAGDGRVD